MKFKRILAMLLSIILILNFASCGKSEDTDTTKKGEATTTEASKTIESTTEDVTDGITTEAESTDPSHEANLRTSHKSLMTPQT